MVQGLKNICDLLGVLYPDLFLIADDCDRVSYLIRQIEIFIGGENA